VDLTHVVEILILGMGGGSVIKTLQDDFKYENIITAIDIDPVIIKIAKEEFDIVENENLKIICEDAQLFMQFNTRKFDLIIIDLFIDIKVPSPFLETAFWQNLVNTHATILCNASLEREDKKLEAIIKFLERNHYSLKKYEKVNNTNTLLVANTMY